MVCLFVIRSMLISTVGVHCDLLSRGVHFSNTNQLSTPQQHCSDKTLHHHQIDTAQGRARTKATRSVGYRNACYNEEVNSER